MSVDTCVGCDGPLRKARGRVFVTCDTADCVGNLTHLEAGDEEADRD